MREINRRLVAIIALCLMLAASAAAQTKAASDDLQLKADERLNAAVKANNSAAQSSSPATGACCSAKATAWLIWSGTFHILLRLDSISHR